MVGNHQVGLECKQSMDQQRQLLLCDKTNYPKIIYLGTLKTCASKGIFDHAGNGISKRRSHNGRRAPNHNDSHLVSRLWYYDVSLNAKTVIIEDGFPVWIVAPHGCGHFHHSINRAAKHDIGLR